MGQGRWRESLRSRKGLLFSFSPFCLFLLLPPFLPHFERAVGSGEGRSPLLSSVYCEPLGVDLAWRSGQEAWVHTTLSLTPFPSSPPAPSRLPPPSCSSCCVHIRSGLGWPLQTWPPPPPPTCCVFSAGRCLPAAVRFYENLSSRLHSQL